MYRCRRDCWSTVDIFTFFIFRERRRGRWHDGSFSQIEIVSLLSVIERSSLRSLLCTHSCAPRNDNSRSIPKTIGKKFHVFCIVVSKVHSYSKRMQKIYKKCRGRLKDVRRIRMFFRRLSVMSSLDIWVISKVSFIFEVRRNYRIAMQWRNKKTACIEDILTCNFRDRRIQKDP